MAASSASWWRLQAEGKVCASSGMGCHKEGNQFPGFSPEPWEAGGVGGGAFARRTRGLSWSNNGRGGKGLIWRQLVSSFCGCSKLLQTFVPYTVRLQI